MVYWAGPLLSKSNAAATFGANDYEASDPVVSMSDW